MNKLLPLIRDYRTQPIFGYLYIINLILELKILFELVFASHHAVDSLLNRLPFWFRRLLLFLAVCHVNQADFPSFAYFTFHLYISWLSFYFTHSNIHILQQFLAQSSHFFFATAIDLSCPICCTLLAFPFRPSIPFKCLFHSSFRAVAKFQLRASIILLYYGVFVCVGVYRRVEHTFTHANKKSVSFCCTS